MVFSVGIGISPGNVGFNDLLKNGYAQRTVKISTNSEEVIFGHFKVSGEITEWLTFEPNTTSFNISVGNPYSLKIIIKVPSDARSDFYSGKLDFITDGIGSPSGRAGGFVRAGVSLLLSAEVTDEEIRKCRAGAFNVKDTEIDLSSIELLYTIANDGNVRISPLVEINVWDQFQENKVLSTEFYNPEILPTVETELVRKISSNDLELGQYWVEVSISECDISKLLSFNVYEKGTIVDKGVFERLSNDVWTYTGDPVEIIATFRNSGPRIVTAKFKGTVKYGGKVMEVIESDEFDVESSKVMDISSYFTPLIPGRYVVSGRIIYNKKLTFEKGNIINVTDKEGAGQNLFLLLIYLFLLVSIWFLFRKIMKERKNRRRF